MTVLRHNLLINQWRNCKKIYDFFHKCASCSGLLKFTSQNISVKTRDKPKASSEFPNNNNYTNGINHAVKSIGYVGKISTLIRLKPEKNEIVHRKTQVLFLSIVLTHLSNYYLFIEL